MLQKNEPHQRCHLCWSPSPSVGGLCNFCQRYQGGLKPDLAQLVRLLEVRLQEGRQALEDNLVRDGERVGWYHHLGERGRTGISSSAYGVHALSLVVPDSSLIREIAQGILNDPHRYVIGAGATLQIAWPMTHEPTTPLVEPTCYVLQQLNQAGVLDANSAEAQASIRWLRSQRRDQAWGPQQSMDPFVYVTALVCQTLSQFCPGTPDLPIALDWLEKAQNDDGGWGELPKDQRSRTWCTANVTLAFILGRSSISKGNEVLGIRWLRENSANWIEPYAVEYEFEIPQDQTRRGRANYRFDALPIVILALLRSGLRPVAPDLLDGINKLLEQQVDGIWLYPYSNQKTIFNLSHAVQGVTEFRKALASPEMLADFYNRMSAIEARQPSDVRAPVRIPSGSRIKSITAVALAILSVFPLIWLLIGSDRLWRLLAQVFLLRNHPVILVSSLSGIMLAVGIVNWVSAKVLFALWVLLITFAVLLSVRGGIWETMAAVSPPLVAALITYLLSWAKERFQNSQ